MRHWFIILLIALLPLRGWVGDAMALQDIAAEPETTVVSANKDHPTAVEAPFSQENGASAMTGRLHAACHETGVAAPTEGLQTGHAAQCNACQICHSAAVSPDLSLPAAPTLPTAAPVFKATAVTSATPAPGLKPPIS